MVPIVKSAVGQVAHVILSFWVGFLTVDAQNYEATVILHFGGPFLLSQMKRIDCTITFYFHKEILFGVAGLFRRWCAILFKESY